MKETAALAPQQCFTSVSTFSLNVDGDSELETSLDSGASPAPSCVPLFVFFVFSLQ